MERIVYSEAPRLRQPYLILGFEGWPNAGEVSSYAIQYLLDHLKTKRFASIPTEDFYQFSVSRPVATIREGRLIEMRSPVNHFYYSRIRGSRDIIFFHGTEPHLQWDRFVDLLLSLAERFSVSQIFTLGGTYDYVPHTCPPVVSAVFSGEELREKVLEAGLELTEYNGPVSIHTFILEAAKEREMEVISLWGHAPQYLQTKNIRVAYSVLQRMTALTGMEVDLSELARASEYFDQQVNHLVEQDSKLREVIKKLEEIYRQSPSASRLLRKEEEAKDDKVVYIQAFLKRQDDGDKAEG